MSILINRVQFPVTSLGHGRRVGIWFQGCTIGCAGCVSLDTWAFDRRKHTTVDELVHVCRSYGNAVPDGITLSGGEPFDQPEALMLLLKQLRGWCVEIAGEMDILCYTGYAYADIEARFPHILGLFDAIVSGPFELHQPTDKLLRGSANQRLLPMTPLGRSRYGKLINAADGQKSFDVQLCEDGIWFAGIPRAGDLERLRAAVAARGVKMRKCTWRA